MSRRQETLLKKYAKKLEHFYNINKKDDDGFPVSKEQQTEILFKKLWSLDPTPKKSRAEVILQWYINSSLKDEDLYKITENLLFFEKHKHLFQEKDPTRYKTYQDFFLSLVPILEKVQENEENGFSENEKEKIYKQQMFQQTRFIEETETYILLSPKTEEASCYWGRGTQWCTAATSSNNYFQDYNKDGPLYILLEKKTPENQKPTKYQFHINSGQFMDIHDSEIDDLDLEEIKKRHIQKPNTLFEKFCKILDQENYGVFEEPTDQDYKTVINLGDYHLYPYMDQSLVTSEMILKALQENNFFSEKKEYHSLLNDEINNLLKQKKPTVFTMLYSKDPNKKQEIFELLQIYPSLDTYYVPHTEEDAIEYIKLEREYSIYAEKTNKDASLEQYIQSTRKEYPVLCSPKLYDAIKEYHPSFFVKNFQNDILLYGTDQQKQDLEDIIRNNSFFQHIHRTKSDDLLLRTIDLSEIEPQTVMKERELTSFSQNDLDNLKKYQPYWVLNRMNYSVNIPEHQTNETLKYIIDCLKYRNRLYFFRPENNSQENILALFQRTLSYLSENPIFENKRSLENLYTEIFQSLKNFQDRESLQKALETEKKFIPVIRVLFDCVKKYKTLNIPINENKERSLEDFIQKLKQKIEKTQNSEMQKNYNKIQAISDIFSVYRKDSPYQDDFLNIIKKFPEFSDKNPDVLVYQFADFLTSGKFAQNPKDQKKYYDFFKENAEEIIQNAETQSYKGESFGEDFFASLSQKDQDKLVHSVLTRWKNSSNSQKSNFSHPGLGTYLPLPVKVVLEEIFYQKTGIIRNEAQENIEKFLETTSQQDRNLFYKKFFPEKIDPPFSTSLKILLALHTKRKQSLKEMSFYLPENPKDHKDFLVNFVRDQKHTTLSERVIENLQKIPEKEFTLQEKIDLCFSTQKKDLFKFSEYSPEEIIRHFTKNVKTFDDILFIYHFSKEILPLSKTEQILNADLPESLTYVSTNQRKISCIDEDSFYEANNYTKNFVLNHIIFQKKPKYLDALLQRTGLAPICEKIKNYPDDIKQTPEFLNLFIVLKIKEGCQKKQDFVESLVQIRPDLTPSQILDYLKKFEEIKNQNTLSIQNAIHQETSELFEKDIKRPFFDQEKTLSPEQALHLVLKIIETHYLESPEEDKNPKNFQYLLNGTLLKEYPYLASLHRDIKECLAQKESPEFLKKALHFLKTYHIEFQLKKSPTLTPHGTVEYQPTEYLAAIKKDHVHSFVKPSPQQQQDFSEFYKTIPDKVSLQDKLDPKTKILLRNIHSENHSTQKKSSPER